MNNNDTVKCTSQKIKFKLKEKRRSIKHINNQRIVLVLFFFVLLEYTVFCLFGISNFYNLFSIHRYLSSILPTLSSNVVLLPNFLVVVLFSGFLFEFFLVSLWGWKYFISDFSSPYKKLICCLSSNNFTNLICSIKLFWFRSLISDKIVNMDYCLWRKLDDSGYSVGLLSLMTNSEKSWSWLSMIWFKKISFSPSRLFWEYYGFHEHNLLLTCLSSWQPFYLFFERLRIDLLRVLFAI